MIFFMKIECNLFSRGALYILIKLTIKCACVLLGKKLLLQYEINLFMLEHFKVSVTYISDFFMFKT